MIVTAYPEAAESMLNKEYEHSQPETGGDSELCEESPVIEYGRTDNALCDIVCHTEFSVWDKQRQHFREPACAVKTEDNAAEENEHECEFGKRWHKYLHLRK